PDSGGSVIFRIAAANG
ncbi:multidrug resistance protein B, partial [Mycobacterium marinum]